MAAAAGSRVQDAKASRDKIADPAARKLVSWYLHRGGFGTALRFAPSSTPIRTGRTAAC